MKTINDYKRWIVAVVTDEQRRRLVMARAIYAVFVGVALMMSIVNVITVRIPLLIATSSFSLLCLVAFLLSLSSEKNQERAENLFVLSVLILFTYFVITGGTDNFSTIWLLLLPTVGLFFFGIVRGSCLVAMMLIIMCVCFYVPGIREYITDYDPTFRTRFPLVYIASYAVSLLLEYVRYMTMEELNILREKYAQFYFHDALTGVCNRYGLYDTYDKIFSSHRSIGILMFDIDHFKKFNDTYGHQNGDNVLKYVAHTATQIVPEGSALCRWGGEEFVIIYADGDTAVDFGQKVLESIRETGLDMHGDTVHITVSIGLAIIRTDKRQPLDTVLEKADALMYEAKGAGRNQVKWKDFRE